MNVPFENNFANYLIETLCQSLVIVKKLYPVFRTLQSSQGSGQREF
jgi:hypothetical protein